MENYKEQQDIDLESVRRVAAKVEEMLAKAAMTELEIGG